MAFPTTQQTNTALFRNLFFRTNDNAPISSLYILQTNGRGNTYWSKSLIPEQLSSFSTLVGSSLTTYQIYTYNLQSTIAYYSTSVFPSSVSFYQSQFNSTYNQHEFEVSSLAIGYISLLNQQLTQYNALQGGLVIQTNQVYISSLAISQSTADSYLDSNTFNNQISSLYSTINLSFSTLSTGIILSQLPVISTISSYITSTFDCTYELSVRNTDQNISTLSSLLVIINKYSTLYGIAQISQFQTLSTQFENQYDIFSTNILSLTSSYISIFSQNQIQTKNLQSNVVDIQLFSSAISTIISTQVSSLTTGIFNMEEEKLSNYYSSLNNQMSSISSYGNENASIVSTLSSFTFTSVSSIIPTNSTIVASISSLQSTFSTISVSTILGSVYSIFNQFELFCNDLVISTTSVINPLQSSVFYSTVLENMSITTNFYLTFFQEPLYISTVNRVSTNTSLFLSSYIGSTLILGNRVITSSIQSTVIGKTNQYNSTTRSVTVRQNSTLAGYTQSSILTNLSSPTGFLLFTISTLGFLNTSTFRQLSISSIRTQDNGFSTQFAIISSLQSTLFQTQVSTNSTFLTSFQLYSTQYNTFFGTTSTLTVQQRSTITTQFISSLTSYTTQYNQMLHSTPVSYVEAITTNTTNTLTTLQISTIQTYSGIVDSLTATISTLAFSTLYTEQRFTLFGSTFQANLDFVNFTNFFINVYDPLLSGTTSSYRITYNFYSVSSIQYKTGIITLNISTPTSLYSNNGGYLHFDLCHEGLPNTIWSEIYPSISTANYMAMYEYTIQNNIIYTNLLNIYPRVTHGELSLRTSTNTSVTNAYWRGSLLTIGWSNYSYFPLSILGIPSYRADVQVDVLISNQIVSQFGPYNANVSSAIINLPYITNSLINPVPTTIRSYIVGNPISNQQITVNMIMPVINYITITSPPNKFLSFGEITANTNTGSNALLSNSRVFSYDGTDTSNAAYEMQAMTFAGTSNSFVSIPNTLPLRVGDSDFTVEWYMNLNDTVNYPSSMTVFAIGTQPAINFGFAFERVITLSEVPELRPVVYLNGVRYPSVSRTGNVIPMGLFWQHYAITRQGGNLFIWNNGTIANDPIVASQNITDSLNAFTIGKETNGTSLTAFKGLITNFHFVNGIALYTSEPYVIPNRPIIPISGSTVLLLNANSASTLSVDSGPYNYPVTVSSISYTRFGKENAVDGNPSTIFIGPSTISNPSAFSQFRIEPQLNATLTSVSSISVRNVPYYLNFNEETSNELEGSYTYNHNLLTGDLVFSHQDLEGATLEVGVPIGTFNYISTIRLRSTQTQTFSF